MRDQHVKSHMIRSIRRSLCLVLVLAGVPPVLAQDAGGSGQDETITKVGTTSAQFLKLGVGARSIALGGAFVAEASDLSALYWNPAGLAGITGSQVQFAYTDYLTDISYSVAGFGVNLGGMGTIAASLILLDSGEMDVRTVEEPLGTGERFEVQDFAMQLSYARALTDRFSIGGSLKYIQERIWHSSASSMAFDVGVLFTTPFERLRLGSSISNFGPKMRMRGRDIVFSIDPAPEQDGTVEIVNSEYLTEKAPLPLIFRVGMALDAVHTADHRVLLATDAAHPNDNSEYINLGAEYTFRELISLRAGYKNLFERDGEQGLTMGGGLNLRLDGAMRVRVDYAYADFGRLEQTHWFTLDLAF